MNTADVLELSERPSAVFLRLKQVIEDTDLKPKKYSWVLLSVMTGKENGVAAKNMPSVKAC